MQAGALGRRLRPGREPRQARPGDRPDQPAEPREEQVRGQPGGRGGVRADGRKDLGLQVSFESQL